MHDLLSRVKRIHELRELEDGWGSYGEPAPSEWACNQALLIINNITMYEDALPYIFPLSEGGIEFEWVRNEMSLRILNDQTYQIYFEDNFLGAFYYEDKWPGYELVTKYIEGILWPES